MLEASPVGLACCEDGFIWGFPEIRGTLFGGPHNKDYSILGSILGSPNFGKLPCRDVCRDIASQT